MRRFVIGDIHGCMKSLRTLIETLQPEPDDELIFLGDYIDRGPDSRDVIDQLIQLRDRCNMLALRGNHEIMLLAVAIGGLPPEHWLASGGIATLTSYGGAIARIPDEHMAFLRGLLPSYETENEIFVHACYEPHVPIDQQPDETLYWKHLGPILPPPHMSGKRVFVGHTPQPQGNILDMGYLVCLDTYCFGRGYLTALNLDTYELTQVDYFGHLRRGNSSPLVRWFGNKWQAISSRIFARRGDGKDVTVSDLPGEVGDSLDEDLAENRQLEQNGVS